MRSLSIDKVATWLVLCAVAVCVFVCVRVSDKVERAIATRNKTTWIMEHDMENKIVEQPTCIEKELPKCGLSVKFYQRPDESMEDFIKRVKIEIGIIEANWSD